MSNPEEGCNCRHLPVGARCLECSGDSRPDFELLADGGETVQSLATRCAQLHYLADGIDDVEWTRVPGVDPSDAEMFASELRDGADELRHRQVPQSGVSR